jgi:hypothetical protein
LNDIRSGSYPDLPNHKYLCISLIIGVEEHLHPLFIES